ncbi:MAG: hypothetical protein ACRDQ2_15850 [Gaiellales bacterium]
MLDRLGAGGWLGTIGGTLALVGGIAAWRSATAGAAAQTTEAPAAEPV